ncbi:hypothetical protein A2U01_0018119, partial [Trifolium medium]|nr:hypothetical protein [Trifolium medium]
QAAAPPPFLSLTSRLLACSLTLPEKRRIFHSMPPRCSFTAWWCDENVLRTTVDPYLRPRSCRRGSVTHEARGASSFLCCLTRSVLGSPNPSRVFINNGVGFASHRLGVVGTWILFVLTDDSFTTIVPCSW